MNMVDENKQGDAEIAWLNAEIEGLQPHKPDALAELGVEVTFLPIFCCCDGKTINAQLKVGKSQNVFSILLHAQKPRIILLMFHGFVSTSGKIVPLSLTIKKINFVRVFS